MPNGNHIELRKMIAPFDATDALEHLEQIFGIEERLLETRQLNGSETPFNEDIVYLAYEGDTLQGMIHATIPHKAPYLAGLSAMFTTPAARGKGLGRILFGKIVEEVSQRGVRLALLGTGNPIAAKLYASFGFGFSPGAHVMARFSQGNMVDFVQDYYQQAKGEITVSRGDPSLRITIIPLVLQKNLGFILDINTGIFNSLVIAQRSCMGLFPRYEVLREHGGDYAMAFDEAGTLGAVSSVAPQEDGSYRADFFALPSFRSAVPRMIRNWEENFGQIYFEIACNDQEKAELLTENGFRFSKEGLCTTKDFLVKTAIYTR